ncbi:MAG: DUF1566 domain-containing protein [Gammaproteobacteria bacterium]|nr:DUF1566 domain-containing protein [Gammaproteobacteria bacterium]
MKLFNRWALSALLLTAIGFSTLANASLVPRLGGLAYYDTVANLTWLADANAAVNSTYDTYSPSTGQMSWADANAWAANLSVAGVTGWRLPNTIDVGNDGTTYTNPYEGVDYGYNITTHSELSNMFYNVLGNTAIVDTGGNSQPGGLINTGPFSNLINGYYWSATVYAPNNGSAWNFIMPFGMQTINTISAPYYGWAVQSGDVGAVPVPAAVWLFGSGLIGLIGIAKRKK